VLENGTLEENPNGEENIIIRINESQGGNNNRY